MLLIVGATSILKQAHRGVMLPSWIVSLMTRTVRGRRRCIGKQNRSNNLGTCRQARRLPDAGDYDESIEYSATIRMSPTLFVALGHEVRLISPQFVKPSNRTK